MPPTAAHLQSVTSTAPLRSHQTAPSSSVTMQTGQPATSAWAAENLIPQPVLPGAARSKSAVTIYKAPAVSAVVTADDTDDSDDAMDEAEDDCSSGSGGGIGGNHLLPPQPVVITTVSTGPPTAPTYNPAASLVPSCPCGCKEDDDNKAQVYNHPDSPLSSPIKTSSATTTSSYQPQQQQQSPDAPLDMSMKGHVTPPPTPPESDREKFRCLYMLVDAAVGQLEKELKNKEKNGTSASSASTSQLAITA